MIVVDTPNCATESTTGGAGLRVGLTSRAATAASPAGSFLSLLLQGQSASTDDASSDVPFSLPTGSGTEPQTTATKTFSSTLSIKPAASETASKRKKTSTETGADPLVLVAPALDLSKAAHWFLSFTSGQSTISSPTSSPSPDLDAQYEAPSAASSGEAIASTGSIQEGKADAVSETSVDVTFARESGLDATAASVTQGAADTPPVAELFLKSSSVPAAATQMAVGRSLVSSNVSAQAASTPARTVSAGDLLPQTAAGSPNLPEIEGKDPKQGSESSFDQSSSGQKEPLAVPKKRSESGSTPGGDSANTAKPQRVDSGIVQREMTPSPAPLSVESESPSNTTAASPATSSARDLLNADAAKPAGSSVGAIELQVRSADDSSVGLRFVERQGRVEVQLKSGSQQTAQALTENLSGLKTSLNEAGWDVQTRVPSPGRNVGFEALDQHVPSSAGQPAATQVLRAGEASGSQMNQQSRSDSSADQDQSRTGRDDSSGRNGQQGRDHSASADSDRHGRRSARESEAWLESIENDWTGSSTGRATTGVRK